MYEGRAHPDHSPRSTNPQNDQLPIDQSPLIPNPDRSTFISIGPIKNPTFSVFIDRGRGIRAPTEMFKPWLKSTAETIVCAQQPRWSQKFIDQFKTLPPSTPLDLQQRLYVRDYQDRLVTISEIFEQGEAGIPLLIEALRDPYEAVRTKAAQCLQSFDRPAVQELMQVLRYRQMKCLKTLQGHTQGITSVAISPDDRLILSTAGEERIYLWDRLTGEIEKTLSQPDQTISQAIFSANGRWIISNASNADILIWEVESGQLVQRLQSHTDRVSALQLAPAGKNLLSASWDGTIGLWDLTSGQLLEQWTGHTDRIYALTISPDGAWVFSGGADGSIRHWKRQAGELVRVYELGKTIVHSLTVHPIQPILFSGDKQVRFSQWNYQTGEHLDTLPAWTYRPIVAIVASPDGEVVLHNCGHGISVWHQATNWFVHTLVHHRWAVSTLAMTQDGRSIISGSDDKTVKIWGWQSLATG